MNLFNQLLKQSQHRPGIYTVAEDRAGQVLLYVTADSATADYRGHSLVVRDGNKMAAQAQYNAWAEQCKAARQAVKPTPPGKYGNGQYSPRWRKTTGGWATK